MLGRSGWRTGMPDPKRPSCSSGHQSVISCGQDPGWEKTWHFTHTYTYPGDTHTHTLCPCEHCTHQVYTSNMCTPRQIHMSVQTQATHVDSGRQTRAQYTSAGDVVWGGHPLEAQCTHVNTWPHTHTYMTEEAGSWYGPGVGGGSPGSDPSSLGDPGQGLPCL